MTHWLFAALLLLPQPAQNERAAGAAIRGVVLSDDAAPVPIRHARVELSGPGKQWIVTGDDGAFAFTGLVAGRYEITADKLGVGRRVFSANLSSPSATAIVLAPGQQLNALRVILPRGAVIAGAVIDTAGVPVEHAIVSAMEQGRPAVSAESDDEGHYRLFGLAPGTYLIRVSPVRATQDSVAAVETFYPNADSPRGAVAVTVAAHEERPGIDVLARRGRRVELSGTVRDAAGQETDAELRLTRAGAIPSDDDPKTNARGGAFYFNGVPAGSYVLQASHRVVASADGSSRTTTHSAIENVEVSDRDQGSISLVLQPPVALSGRASLTPAESGGAAPTALPRLVLTRGDELFEAAIQSNGSFVFSNLAPGSYVLRPLAAAESGSKTWIVESASLDGRDVLRQSIDITTAARAGLTVSVTPNVGALRGRISNTAGAGAPQLAIVVMSADHQKWATSRPTVVWPDTNGDWSIEALVAGDYHVAALGDVSAADLVRPDYLEAIANASVTVGVKAGAVAVQDLKIR